MGLIHTEVELSNPGNRELARPYGRVGSFAGAKLLRRKLRAALRVVALVDTGAITLCIPEHVAVRLSLSELERREVTTAAGNRVSVPYVGPVQVGFGNRSCFTGALVLGDSVLLGSIPLEDMDLVINPRRQEVTVNPESPDIPSAVVMTPARR